MCSFCTREGSLSKFFFLLVKYFCADLNTFLIRKKCMILSVKIIIGFFNGILKQKIKIILNQRKQLVSCLKITLNFKGKNYQIEN